MKNNNTNKFSPMVIVGLVGSMILAMLSLRVIAVTESRCQFEQMNELPIQGTTYSSCWYERVQDLRYSSPPGFMSASDYMFPSYHFQFSINKFLSSGEGKTVILLISGSVGFLALAGLGFGLKINKSRSSTISAPPILSAGL